MHPGQTKSLKIAVQLLLESSILLALVSCGRQAPNAPLPAGTYSAGAIASGAAALNGGFFPLQIGNHWRAASDDHYRAGPFEGPPYEELRIHTEYDRTLIGTETVSGRQYVVLQETWTANDPFTAEPRSGTYWIRYRQDALGLYEADVSLPTPPNLDSRDATPVAPLTGDSAPLETLSHALSPSNSIPKEQTPLFEAARERLYARAAIARSTFNHWVSAAGSGRSRGGVLPGEITRLLYPLHPGASWVSRADPLFSSQVEAIENLTLPAGRFTGYRIRIDNEALGPGDFVYLWMGRSGELAARLHLESDITDDDGTVLGKATEDYDEVLHEVSLVK